jgi:hypothetical protein
MKHTFKLLHLSILLPYAQKLDLPQKVVISIWSNIYGDPSSQMLDLAEKPFRPNLFLQWDGLQAVLKNVRPERIAKEGGGYSI